MKCIYWNTSGQGNFNIIIDILNHELPDILFLSELPDEIIDLNSVNLEKIEYEHFLNPGCNRVSIVKKKKLRLNLCKQSTYYTTVRHIEQNIYIISVHLPSQMYQSLDALKAFLRVFRAEIDTEIGDSLLKNIIIIGDFNINPFEKAMIDFDGFSASNSSLLRREAVHLGQRKPLYYNPTWQLYGKNKFPGTKYFKRPSGSSFDILEHHYLDQVVLSYHMSKVIRHENIAVLERTENYTFLDSVQNACRLSDHLPLIYEFKFE